MRVFERDDKRELVIILIVKMQHGAANSDSDYFNSQWRLYHGIQE